MTQYFMNPKTGEVRSADDWIATGLTPKYMPDFARWAALNLIEVREPLTENEFDEYGAWVPVGDE